MEPSLERVLAGAAVGCAAESREDETDVDTMEIGEPRLDGISEEQDEARTEVPHALYVRSGELTPGEEESGPVPDPWQARLGPVPDPWYHEGSSPGSGSGSDPNKKP